MDELIRVEDLNHIPNHPGLYVFKDTQTGKCYCGATSDIERGYRRRVEKIQGHVGVWRDVQTEQLQHEVYQAKDQDMASKVMKDLVENQGWIRL